MTWDPNFKGKLFNCFFSPSKFYFPPQRQFFPCILRDMFPAGMYGVAFVGDEHTLLYSSTQTRVIFFSVSIIFLKYFLCLCSWNTLPKCIYMSLGACISGLIWNMCEWPFNLWIEFLFQFRKTFGFDDCLGFIFIKILCCSILLLLTNVPRVA